MTGEAPVLGDIEVGDAVFVCGFSDGGRNIEKRLRDIGFSEGSLVECVGESPLGGMARTGRYTGHLPDGCRPPEAFSTAPG